MIDLQASENQLRWPLEVFLTEFDAVRSDSAEVALLLEHAMVGATLSEQILADNGFDADRIVSELNRRLDEIGEAPARSYYRARTTASTPARETRWESAFKAWSALVVDLDRSGWFDKLFGKDCPDAPRGEQPHEKAARDLGFEATWPPTFKHIGIEGLTEDTDREDIENFLSLVEWVGDHVARPRRIERTHLWDSCGRHYARFSIETGKLVYYSRVNSLLSQQRIPFVLADAGADAGYVVERVDDARTDLLTRAVETAPADSQSEVEAAISQFRRHGADRSDKHAAVLSLFRVLENLRTDVKDHLLSQDERDLQHRQQLRHSAQEQEPEERLPHRNA